jgi:hypothetical protein
MNGTETSIRVLIGTLPPTAKARLLRELAAETSPLQGKERLIRRAEAAEVLSRSTRAIDLLVAQGHLRKVILPGRKRGGGFLASEVSALISGNGGAQ